MLPRPLVASRRAAGAVVIACGGLVLAGGVIFFHAVGGNEVDGRIYGWILQLFPHGVLRALLALSSPTLVVACDAMVALAALVTRRIRLAVLAVLGPATATVLTEYVLKPVVRRHMFPPPYAWRQGWYYPSGHETGLASLTTLLVIVVLSSTASRAIARAAVAAAASIDVVAAIGLTGSLYHFATDTVAAIAVSVGSVVGVALIVDGWWMRRRPTGRPTVWPTTESALPVACPATTTPPRAGADRPRPFPR